MPHQLYGFNINAAESNEATVLDIVRRLRSKSHTVMHGVTLARKIYDVVGQTTGEQPIIVCREDWPDQNWQDGKYSSMAAYFSQWKTRGGYWPQAYVYTFNEPVVEGDTNKLKSMLNKSIEAMNASANTGVKAVIGNYADASTFEKGWIDAGLFDEWCRTASQYSNGGYGYIGHHNYSYGLPWIGSAGTPNSQLQSINPQPPTADAFQKTRVWENWLQGRFMWPLLQCDKLGVPRYQFICTEGVWDRMPNGEYEGWIPQAEAFWGLGKLRGPLDQRALWAKLYPNLPQVRAGIVQLTGLAEMMRGLSCHAIHLFTLSKNPEWVTFDFLNWPEFINELAAYGQSNLWTPGKVTAPVTTIPKPSVTGVPRVVRPASSISANVREQPRLTATIVSEVKNGDLVTVFYPSSPVQSGGFTWVYVEGSTKPGWVANVVQFIELSPPPNVKLAVPFTSQHNTGNRNNCGPAMLRSILAWELQGGIVPTVLEINQFLHKGDAYEDVDDLIRGADHWGVTLTRATFSEDLVASELESGHAVGALVTRGALQLGFGDFDGNHFITIVGYGAGYYLIHDPYGGGGYGIRGEYENVSATNLKAALINSRLLTARLKAPQQEGWRDLLDEHQRLEVAFAQHYASDYGHNTDGHVRLVLIDQLAKLLDQR